MEDEIVFRPSADYRRTLGQGVGIALAFYLFIQLAVLDDMVGRLMFTLFFGMFLIVYVLFTISRSKRPLHEVRLNKNGIHYQPMLERYGIEMVPWREIEDMDLFANHSEGIGSVGHFLRITLRPGALRDSLKRPYTEKLGFGLDVNIPVDVDAEPKVVLSAAKEVWSRHA